MEMEREGFDSLIRSAQAGDQEALKKLLVAARPYLAKVATGYADPSRASESVSDLIQEAELRAWQRLHQFQGGSADEETHAKFRTWLVQIVRRIVFDRWRAMNTQRRKAPDVQMQSIDGPRGSPSVDSSAGASSRGPSAPGPSPSAELRETERSALVRQALARVEDPEDREIIRLYFFEQMSLPDIARRLGHTYDRVRGQYRRGVRQLQTYLQALRSG
jgi:RNA polymerase sigma factor (sigma-70 family)